MYVNMFRQNTDHNGKIKYPNKGRPASFYAIF